MTRLGFRAGPLLAALLLATLGCWVSPATAFACDCSGLSTARALRQADAVFRGVLVDSDDVGRGADARTDLRFQVELVFKGAVYAEQVVATPGPHAGCRLGPQVGSRWVIFAVEDVVGQGDQAVSRLVTTLCSGNLLGAADPGLLAGREPLPGRSDRAETSLNADRAITRWLRVAAVGGLAALLLGGVGLWVLWRPGGPHRPS